MLDLLIVVLLVITKISIFLTVRLGKMMNKSKTVKKGALVINLLNYLPALLLGPTYLYYILRYFKYGQVLNHVPNINFFILGALLLIMSLYLYSDSIFCMGKMWTIGLELRKRHRLIKIHAYKYIRHPIYTAWFIIIISSALILSSALIASFILPVFGWYYLRAKMEESFLAENLPGYKSYLRSTKGFIPFLL